MAVESVGRHLRFPRQERSRARTALLLDAASALMHTRPFDQIAVAEIARRAGTSVGGFYARFPTKEALLHVIDARIVADCLAAFDWALSDRVMANATVAEVVTAYTRVMVTKFREHHATLVQILRAAKSGDPDWAARTAAFNAHVHSRLRVLLEARRNQIRHENPSLAINLGLAFTSAAAREVMLANSLRVYPVRVDDERLIVELARMWMRYLGADWTSDPTGEPPC